MLVPGLLGPPPPTNTVLDSDRTRPGGRPLDDLLQHLQDALSGRYRVESEIGRGGMATVFLAEDLKHHRRVATHA